MPKAKAKGYRVAVDRAGRVSAGAGAPAHLGKEWTPEHLLLVALARCVVAALAYHARREDLWLQASAEARGKVARREDGSWGFVEIECTVDARLDPEPADARDLLARAARGCFIGASLEPTPTYVWLVNGRSVPS